MSFEIDKIANIADDDHAADVIVIFMVFFMCITAVMFELLGPLPEALRFDVSLGNAAAAMYAALPQELRRRIRLVVSEIVIFLERWELSPSANPYLIFPLVLAVHAPPFNTPPYMAVLDLRKGVQNAFWMCGIVMVVDMLAAALQHSRKRRLEKDEDICKYLGQFFGNVPALFEGMAKSGAMIIGPRALDFFAPGSCSETAAFEVSVNSSAVCVGTIVSALEQSGVRFQGVFDIFEKMKQATDHCDPENVFTILRQDLEVLVEHLELLVEQAEEFSDHFDAATIEQITELGARMKNHPERQSFKVDGALLRTIPHLPGSSTPPIYAEKEFQITGHTSQNGTSVPVTIRFKSDKTPLDFVFDYRSSAIQSFISAFGAVHFYHETAAARVAYLWHGNSNTNDHAGDLCDFKYVQHSTKPSVLHHIKSTDTPAKVVHYAFGHGEGDLRQLREQALNNLMWEETPERTILYQWIASDMARVATQNLERDVTRDRMGAASEDEKAAYRAAVQKTAAFIEMGVRGNAVDRF